MEPQKSQFPGVNIVPAGSRPLTPKSPSIAPFPDYYKTITPPAKINAATGGTENSKYARGEKMGGKGEASVGMKPEPRPKPNQGVTVPGTGGKPPVTIGGEKPGAVKVQPLKPKGRPIGGALGGIFGIKNR